MKKFTNRLRSLRQIAGPTSWTQVRRPVCAAPRQRDCVVQVFVRTSTVRTNTSEELDACGHLFRGCRARSLRKKGAPLMVVTNPLGTKFVGIARLPGVDHFTHLLRVSLPPCTVRLVAFVAICFAPCTQTLARLLWVRESPSVRAGTVLRGVFSVALAGLRSIFLGIRTDSCELQFSLPCKLRLIFFRVGLFPRASCDAFTRLPFIIR